MLKKLIGAIATFFAITTGLDWLWSTLEIQSPPKIWALSVTTIFLIMYMAFGYCTFRQQTLLQRIEECAKAKARLERAVLRKRRSSKKR